MGSAASTSCQYDALPPSTGDGMRPVVRNVAKAASHREDRGECRLVRFSDWGT